MYTIFLLLTLLVITFGTLQAYARTGDAFHPAVVVALPLAFMYALWPLLVNSDGALNFLIGEDGLDYAGGLYFSGVLFFYIGLLRLPKPGVLIYIRAQDRGVNQSLFSSSLTPRLRTQITGLAIVLGVIALLAYLYMIFNVGGFFAAYGRAKGGGAADSGYIGEAVLLSFPAIMLLAIARQGSKRLRLTDIAMALLIASPHLIQGTLGGRRGPLFLVLTVLFFAWLVVQSRRPSLRLLMLALAVIGSAVLLVQSQRQHLYLGSEGQFEIERAAQIIDTENLESSDYVAGVATVLTRKYHEDYFWGGRYFITVFVRPIPRQLWPTKYEDMAWLYEVVEGGGDWTDVGDALGFQPPKGSAVGFIADIYQEFAWGALAVIFLFGWGLSALWRRHRLRGGVWTAIFAQAMILTIYIPTQSFSAFYHRFLFMAIITVLTWRFWIGFRLRGNPRELPSMSGRQALRK